MRVQVICEQALCEQGSNQAFMVFRLSRWQTFRIYIYIYEYCLYRNLTIANLAWSIWFVRLYTKCIINNEWCSHIKRLSSIRRTNAAVKGATRAARTNHGCQSNARCVFFDGYIFMPSWWTYLIYILKYAAHCLYTLGIGSCTQSFWWKSIYILMTI